MKFQEKVLKEIEDFKNDNGNYYGIIFDPDDNDMDCLNRINSVLYQLKKNEEIKNAKFTCTDVVDFPGYSAEVVSVAIVTNDDDIELFTVILEAY